MAADATRFRTSLRGWSKRVANEWNDELVIAMKQEAPVSTPTPTSTRPPGQLRDSIRGQHSSGGVSSFRTRLEAPVIQAATTAKGARPHIIRPVRAKRLRFYSQSAGAIVFARVVHHPGNRGTDWWAKGLRARAQETLSRAGRRTRF